LKAWAEATKKAVEESVAVTKAKEIGGDALVKANESYAAAWTLAEEKRLEAVKLSSVYLTAAQVQLVALVETEQGKKLRERTKKLLELTKSKTSDLPLIKSAATQLEVSYKLASECVKAAQDWVTTVLGYQNEGSSSGVKIVTKQMELVDVLESGAEPGDDISKEETF